MNLDFNTIHFSATQIALYLGMAVPFLTVLFTKLHATGTLKTVMAAFLAGLAAVLSGVMSVTGSVTLGQLLVSFVVAGISAGASRKWLTEDAVTKLGAFTAKFGVGAAVPKPDHLAK